MAKIKERVCTRCVMDTTDPNIVFNPKGECNHCIDWFKKMEKYNYSNKYDIHKLVEEVKESSKDSEYDCIIGISGGVDSTYLAYILVEKYKLNPLAVHFDNGWNSKQAVKNIKNLIKILDIDLETYVVDWEEYKELQKAYFKASVIDIEALTDHAIIATLYKTAEENNLKYILNGFNIKTELIIPKNWTFNKNDSKNLKDIIRKNSSVEIKSLPTISEKKIKEIKKNLVSINLFSYIDYNDSEAKKTIIEKLKWLDYGGKHYESVFTRFYQGYILPKKFNVDKRKAHLSCLVCSNDITRDKALEILKTDFYPQEKQQEDLKYVLKKLDFTADEFENYMKKDRVSHFKYKTNFTSFLRKKINLPDRFFNKIKYIK